MQARPRNTNKDAWVDTTATETNRRTAHRNCRMHDALRTRTTSQMEEAIRHLDMERNIPYHTPSPRKGTGHVPHSRSRHHYLERSDHAAQADSPGAGCRHGR